MANQFCKPRHNSRKPVIVITPQGVRQGVFVDISETGARIDVTGDMCRGDKVVLRMGHEEVNAIVSWSGEGRIGVGFRPQLLPRVLSQLVEELPSERNWAARHHLDELR